MDTSKIGTAAFKSQPPPLSEDESRKLRWGWSLSETAAERLGRLISAKARFAGNIAEMESNLAYERAELAACEEAERSLRAECEHHGVKPLMNGVAIEGWL